MKCRPLITLLAFVSVLLAADREPVEALKGLDPVELARGKEVPGREDLKAVQGLYRYQFATKENLKEFVSLRQSGREVRERSHRHRGGDQGE